MKSCFYVSDKVAFAYNKTWSATPEHVYTSSLMYIEFYFQFLDPIVG